MTNDKITEQSLMYHGVKQCFNQTIEELAELTVEVSKNIRGFNNRDNVKEEIADVLNCIEYLKRVLNISEDEIELVKDAKLKRLEERMKGNE